MFTVRNGGTTLTIAASIPITKVVVTAVTGDPANRLSGNGYTTQDNIGTWTGSDFSVTLVNNASDWIGISSIEVFLNKDASVQIPEYVDFACNGTLYGTDSLVGEAPFFTIIQKQGSGSNPPAYTNPWRIYGGNTVEIKMKNGLGIIGLEIEHPESHIGDNFGFEPAANETIAEPTDGTVLRTITLEEAAERLLINNTSKNQSRWKRVRVYIGDFADQSLRLNRKQFDFGTVKPGSSLTLTLAITANKAMQLLSTQYPEDVFSLAEELPVSLDEKSTTVLHFSFAPVQTGSYDSHLKLVFSDTVISLPIIAQCKERIPLTSVVNRDLPAGGAFYDFHDEGSKGYAYTASNRTIQTRSQINGYADEKTLSPTNWLNRVDYVEDINSDGYPDFCQYDYYGGSRNNVCAMLLSNADGTYRYIPGAWFLPHLDLNQDGKTDYLSYKVHSVSGTGYSGQIFIYTNYWTELVLHLSTPTGTHKETNIATLSKEAYEDVFDPDAWYEENNTGEGGISVWVPTGPVGGVTLTGTIAYNSTTYGLPTLVIDLNGDGRPDLVDETNGYIFYNMSDTRWISQYTGGYTKVLDADRDGYPDFIANHNGALVYLKYKGEGVYEESTLFENVLDDKFYVTDLNNDNYPDLITTISYSKTETASYIVSFLNDGKGNFTQQPEFSSNEAYEFQSMQDIDGDGRMDLLAWKGKKDDSRLDVAMFKGQGNGQFGNPTTIIEALPNNTARLAINAADLDDDGIMEVWVSGTESGSTRIYRIDGSPAFSAPQKPEAPVLSYDRANNSLQINWNEGHDEHTSNCDLTYSLRIGTTPNGSEILSANALPNGQRKNFHSGNQLNNLSAHFDLSSWVPGTYYVSLQTINTYHAGSEWSEAVAFTHKGLPGFEADKSEMSFTDTLTLYFTPLPEDYTFAWDLDDGKICGEGKGYKKLTFATNGEKILRMSLTSPDGQSASFRKKTYVLPNYFSDTDTVQKESNAAYIDYNNDSYPDMVLTDGVYLNDGTGRFSKPAALWNTGLLFSKFVVADYDRNGFADIVYKGNGISDGYLANNGSGTFTRKSDDHAASFIDRWKGRDFNGDGILDGAITYNGNTRIVAFLKGNADGSASQVKPSCANGNFTDFEGRGYDHELTTTEGAYYLVNSAEEDNVQDFNRDGLPDPYLLMEHRENGYPAGYFNGVWIYMNEGDFAFSEYFLPFAKQIPTEDFGGRYWVDMNADGFLDLVAYRSGDNGTAFYILYNQNNQSFSEPVFVNLPGLKKEKPDKSLTDGMAFYDADNNGYPDVLFGAESESDQTGAYIVYFRENGVQRHWFKTGASFKYINELTDLNADGMVDFALQGTDYRYYSGLLKSVLPNEKPSVPGGLKAEQNENGLYITWEPATDDHTPYSSMRYNVSVKRKGASGAGSYIISPLNGGLEQTALQPCHRTYGQKANTSEYSYWSGTECWIPVQVLTSGEELEISVQAIDLLGRTSEFSQTLNYQVGANARISAPATACMNNPTVISYAGTASSATPVWDFDGGEVLQGSGFGPYTVQWNNAGSKRISLQLEGTESYVNIWVNEPLNARFTVAEYVQYDVPTPIQLPEVSPTATFKWEVELGESGVFVDPYNNSFGYNVMVEAKAGNRYGSIRICRNPEIKTRRLRLTVTQNDCEAAYTSPIIHLIGEDDMPEIAYVSPDAAGNQTIHWESGNLPDGSTAMQVQKETSYAGEFETLATVDLNKGSYTDLQSNAAVKSERYRLQLMFGEDTGPYSHVHQTVHLAINKGMQQGQYNLFWNPYSGRQIASYRILRGNDAENLSLLTTLNANLTSYTDMNAGTEEVFYAIEYELYSETYTPAAKETDAAKENNRYTGQSNTVSSAEARSITMAQNINILSVTKTDRTTGSNPNLYLYAEIFPATATYKTANWSLETGNETLATINQDGRLQAVTDNPGGYVTVKAVTVDGSNLTATKRIYIAAYDGQNSSGDDERVPVSGVSLDKTSLELNVSQTYSLTATVLPENATDKSLSWSSSAENVATVNATGLVRAVSAGQAVISVVASDGGYRASCTVTVKNGSDPETFNIAQLRQQNVDNSTVYEISTICALTANGGQRNQKWIQDESGRGILIDDPNKVITGEYEVGNNLSGIKGTLSSYFGALQLTPTQDAHRENNNSVVITPLALSSANGFGSAVLQPLEGTLVSVSGCKFQQSGNFADGQNYTAVCGGKNLPVRIHIYHTSLNGMSIPQEETDITGLVVVRDNTNFYISPRFKEDLQKRIPGTNQENLLSAVKIYPNPSSGLFTVEISCALQAVVYTENGKQVCAYHWQQAGRYTIDLTHRSSAFYLLHLSSSTAEKTIKLVIE